MPDEVITGSRARAAVLAAGGVLMSALCGWVLTLPDIGLKGLLAGWVGVPFFALCAVAGAWQAARPLTLTLDASGFSISRLMGPPKRVAWADIEPFFLWTMRSTSLLAFKYREGRRPAQRSALERANEAFGVDGSLPTTLPIKPQALLERMNRLRAQAITAGGDR